MMRASINRKEAASILRQIRAASEKGNAMIAGALYEKANQIMTESKEEVPKDHGALVNSGYVSQPDFNSASPVVEIGYGTDYAVPVHEIPPSGGGRTAQHNPPTKWRYLRDPFNHHSETLLQWVALRAKEFFTQGNFDRRRRGRAEKKFPTAPAVEGR